MPVLYQIGSLNSNFYKQNLFFFYDSNTFIQAAFYPLIYNAFSR